LVKDAKADCTLKNKFGYNATDIAHDMNIRILFDQLLGTKSAGDGKEI